MTNVSADHSSTSKFEDVRIVNIAVPNVSTDTEIHKQFFSKDAVSRSICSVEHKLRTSRCSTYSVGLRLEVRQNVWQYSGSESRRVSPTVSLTVSLTLAAIAERQTLTSFLIYFVRRECTRTIVFFALFSQMILILNDKRAIRMALSSLTVR